MDMAPNALIIRLIKGLEWLSFRANSCYTILTNDSILWMKIPDELCALLLFLIPKLFWRKLSNFFIKVNYS
jgi:hypothetical protein